MISICPFWRAGKALARIAATTAIAAGMAAGTAHAQSTEKIRFSLDWRFEGQTSFVWIAQQKGYFKEEGLDVLIRKQPIPLLTEHGETEVHRPPLVAA